MSDPLPLRQFDATDPHALREWLTDLRARRGDDDAFEVIAEAVGALGREYQRVSAALVAKTRGHRQGGSEAYDRQETIAWAERAEERVDGASAEGESVADAPVEPEEAAGAPVGDETPRRRGHRQPFPASWPRVEVPLAVDGPARICAVCGLEKRCIGHVRSEILAIEPARLYVSVHVREKLACRDECDGVVTAPAVPRLVPQSSCDLSLSLDLLDRKLVQHLPIYRVQEIYARLGVPIAESTLDRWYADGLGALTVVARAIRAAATAPVRFRLNVDDTTIPILDRDAPNGLLVGHLWLVVGDGRYVAARASRDWTKEHAVAAVGEFAGYLQADAYAGFDCIFKNPKRHVIEVGCWAHARRYFVKAKDRGDKLAEEALGLIARLYAVEKDADEKKLTPEQRLELRRVRSRRALDLLWAWTRKVGTKVRPKSPLGKGLRYLANQRVALEQFLEDGRLPLDNTAVEREMKPIILGRKNWLFAGSFASAELLADGVTVVATARLHGLDPVAYLAWLLPQLARREWSEQAAATQLMPEHFAEFLARKKGDASESTVHAAE